MHEQNDDELECDEELLIWKRPKYPYVAILDTQLLVSNLISAENDEADQYDTHNVK